MTVIAPGERAMCHSLEGAREVHVRTYRYTRRGGVYDLEPPPGMKDWIINAAIVQPIHGETRMIRQNLMTGETKELDD